MTTFLLFDNNVIDDKDKHSINFKNYIFSLKPLTPMSDQDRISPYSINTISTR